METHASRIADKDYRLPDAFVLWLLGGYVGEGYVKLSCDTPDTTGLVVSTNKAPFFQIELEISRSCFWYLAETLENSPWAQEAGWECYGNLTDQSGDGYLMAGVTRKGLLEATHTTKFGCLVHIITELWRNGVCK